MKTEELLETLREERGDHRDYAPAGPPNNTTEYGSKPPIQNTHETDAGDLANGHQPADNKFTPQEIESGKKGVGDARAALEGKPQLGQIALLDLPPAE